MTAPSGCFALQTSQWPSLPRMRYGTSAQPFGLFAHPSSQPAATRCVRASISAAALSQSAGSERAACDRLICSRGVGSGAARSLPNDFVRWSTSLTTSPRRASMRSLSAAAHPAMPPAASSRERAARLESSSWCSRLISGCCMLLRSSFTRVPGSATPSATMNSPTTVCATPVALAAAWASATIAETSASGTTGLCDCGSVAEGHCGARCLVSRDSSSRTAAAWFRISATRFSCCSAAG
mmetsp:Transcript_16515/g.49115  ORF Transcript_16515/g.49115 Transcript_16515/m.49115 type:complete len:239 (-) Transcript_16515:136-852(-)